MRPQREAAECRVYELANILAAGVLRQHKARHFAEIPVLSPRQPGDSLDAECLELSSETVLTVQTS
jgi:hypothetical protein